MAVIEHSADERDPLAELRDALDDAIRRAYCEPLKPVAEGEDAEIVRAMRRSALLTDPDLMRHLAGIQADAWEAVEARVEGGSCDGV